jgi:intracellular sulfur oxidation DsrE/DsrF family protein
MLIPGKSPVAERVESISQNYENVSFRACSNTLAKMSKKAGKDIQLMPQAKMVPSGVIHLVQRQEEGWSYLRP